MDKLSKLQRLLRSFAAVQIQPEHRNHGNETQTLRGWGFSPVVSRHLIRWGEQHQLACYFESGKGKTNHSYYWMNEFLFAAIRKHVEMFGAAARDDFPHDLIDAFDGQNRA